MFVFPRQIWVETSSDSRSNRVVNFPLAYRIGEVEVDEPVSLRWALAHEQFVVKLEPFNVRAGNHEPVVFDDRVVDPVTNGRGNRFSPITTS